jgi:hypothetical protein
LYRRRWEIPISNFRFPQHPSKWRPVYLLCETSWKLLPAPSTRSAVVTAKELTVTPDIETREEEAFDSAYKMALEQVIEGIGERPGWWQKNLLVEAKETLVKLSEIHTSKWKGSLLILQAAGMIGWAKKEFEAW